MAANTDKQQLNRMLFLSYGKAHIYVGTKRYKEACILYEDVIAIKDSLSSINFARQLDEIRSVYEVDKLEIKAEKDRLNFILLSSGMLALSIVCLLMGIIIFIVRRNSKRLEEKNRNLFLQLKEKDALQAEITRLNKNCPQEETKNDPLLGTVLFSRLQKWLDAEKRFTSLKITPEEVATELSTNTRYLYDTIRQATGQTFNDYINNLKLEYARKLLLSDKKSQLTIEGISTEAGFNTRSNFYRVFRLKYGLTPSELRKQKKNTTKENT